MVRTWTCQTPRRHRFPEQPRPRVNAIDPFVRDSRERTSFLSRRQLLQAGLVQAVGLSLPHLLAANAAARSPRSAAKSCIFIMLNGGPSHIDTFDPKPDAPAEIRGPYRAIATRTPGVRLC